MFAKCRLGAVCYYVNDVNRTAAFYRDDIYVDRDLSLETAAAVRGLQVW